MILEQESIDVFLGLNVGKTGHHTVTLNRAGPGRNSTTTPCRRTKPKSATSSPSSPATERSSWSWISLATVGALPVAVAAAGVAVGYLPELPMRRIADLHPGQAKTDARDAPITQIHPALERALGPHLDHPAVADLLTRYSTPPALKTASRGHMKARLKKHAPRAAERLTEAVFTALGEQTVVVVGTGAAGIVLPKLAEQLLALHRQRDEIATQVEALVEARPLYAVLTSIPGIGVRTCARILTEVTGKHFASAAHLASCAGIAPATRRSGTSIRGEHPSRRGNKKSKRALFLSAFTALHHPPPRAYYDRKRAGGKRHSQVVIALARRRSKVLFAMPRDGTLHEEPAPKNLPSAVYENSTAPIRLWEIPSNLSHRRRQQIIVITVMLTMTAPSIIGNIVAPCEGISQAPRTASHLRRCDSTPMQPPSSG